MWLLPWKKLLELTSTSKTASSTPMLTSTLVGDPAFLASALGKCLASSANNQLVLYVSSFHCSVAPLSSLPCLCYKQTLNAWLCMQAWCTKRWDSQLSISLYCLRYPELLAIWLTGRSPLQTLTPKSCDLNKITRRATHQNTLICFALLYFVD